ncbi:PREDICTED: dnaJ homolog subfamily C member 7 isoform X1 [Nelumbo nucifera]|uniref:DnaJ homolog subfamily C member 7 isoform X1 n=1 Tax=Nelumbo nucifera TaxID=4432 RepID=A0A1U8ATT6_NELNU|nr:PREDICTED: dnaJ homolog subfamily C member 7 isoform X1 [Nelumbo nucifera]
MLNRRNREREKKAESVPGVYLKRYLCTFVCYYLVFGCTRSYVKKMMWEEWEYQAGDDKEEEEVEQDGPVDFDFLSLLPKPKDYYKILEVSYDATEDTIRSNYIRLALKWHPDKRKDQDGATSRFQEINEAYQVLSDPVKRREYDSKGMERVYDYNIIEYLNRYKGLILTCNGLGIRNSIW